ncbi:MAG: tetratricopeptide repeat protein [Planctomycetota bacterium]
MRSLPPRSELVRHLVGAWTRSPVLPACLLVLMTWAAYLPALGGDFVFDDRLYLTEDGRMDSVGGLERIWTEVGGPDYRHQYYPLTSSAFWVQHQLWGDDPVGYHLVNILLHALNAILLWRLLRGLGLPAAWLAAAVFAVHPVHVQSVAWISELKNVLSMAFFLSSMHLFVRYLGAAGSGPGGRAAMYAGGLALFVCALLSKTATCLLPVALLLVVWWKRGRIDRRSLLAVAPLVAVGAAFVLMTAYLESHYRAHGAAYAHSGLERALIAGRALWFYAGKLAWPSQLVLIYPRWTVDATAWWQYLYPGAAVAAVAALWGLRHRIGRGPLAAVAFFIVALAPLSFVNVAFTRYSYVADHWQYWASMGLIALGVAAAAHVCDRWRQLAAGRWAVGTAALLVIGTLSGLTWQRAAVFGGPTALWQDTVSKNPGSRAARYSLGVALQREGPTEDAIRQYGAALQIAPDDVLAHNNLGIALRTRGRLEEAIEHYETAIRIAPGFAKARTNLGDALQAQGRVEEAIRQYEAALRARPDFAGAHYNLAVALRSVGRIDEAIEHYETVLSLAPRAVDAHVNLGEALQAQGRFDEAIRHYSRALEISPDFPPAQNNLRIALEQR